MRPIDADTLVVELEKDEAFFDKEAEEARENSNNCTEGYANAMQSRVDGIRDAIIEIYDAPTIDRPKGEWIVNIFDYKSMCSVCGANETHFIYGTEMWYGLGKSNFCPYCGAKMKGVDDETEMS